MKQNIKEKVLKEVMEDEGTWWIHSDTLRGLKEGEFKARLLTDRVEFKESIELAIDKTLAEVGKVINDLDNVLEEKAKGDTHVGGCGDPSECHYDNAVWDCQRELKEALEIK